MRGLKTQEGKRFERFFDLVQKTAAEKNAVFFLECGEGNEFNAENIEGEDLRGWLIPNSLAEAFEKEWINENPDEAWAERIAWAMWSGSPDNPKIELKTF